MKKFIIVSWIVVLLVLITGCTGPDGSAFQKYWWTGSLGYIYDTNPSTPNTIYNDVYFSTNSGSFYMEYESWNGSAWYMYYTITTKKGELFNTAGGDTWFEILLLSTGPSLYEWDSARSIQYNEVSKKSSEFSDTIDLSNQKLSIGKELSVILGVEEKEYPFGSIKIEWGKIQEN